jgi:CRP-like cAMP-binding protein
VISKDVVVSTVFPGEIFGWSALIPPNHATAGALAITPSKVLGFDIQALKSQLEANPAFVYLITLKIAQVIRGRLRNMRTETLAETLGERV